MYAVGNHILDLVFKQYTLECLISNFMVTVTGHTYLLSHFYLQKISGSIRVHNVYVMSQKLSLDGWIWWKIESAIVSAYFVVHDTNGIILDPLYYMHTNPFDQTLWVDAHTNPLFRLPHILWQVLLRCN